MSREILFRGKRKDNGEWVEGFYVCNRYSIGFAKEPVIYENHYIYTKRIDSEKWFKTIQVEVIPETVGQYTGLTDKNGKKVYIGDIIKASHNFYPYTVFVRGCKVCIEDKYGNAIRPTTEALKHFDSEVIGTVFDKESDNGD